jgi:hypothetical protein
MATARVENILFYLKIFYSILPGPSRESILEVLKKKQPQGMAAHDMCYTAASSSTFHCSIFLDISAHSPPTTSHVIVTVQ